MGNLCSKSGTVDVTSEASVPKEMGNSSSQEKAKDAPAAAVAERGPDKSAQVIQKPIPPPPEQRTKAVSVVVCQYNDMNDGEMKEVTVNGHAVLLARDQGSYYAVSAKCTHYGAPLVKGALCKGRVRCPWHGACFNLATGDIEDFPGLDSLQSFEVEINDGKVAIHTDEVKLSSTKRVKSMLTRDLECTLLYLIVGGGAAAMECAETLRQNGYKGKLMIVTKENDPPYDRPKLSKALTSTAADLALRTKEFYSVYDIDVMTGMEAFKLDTNMNHMVFRGKEWTDYTIEYDQLMIATGGRPHTIDVPGSDLGNIFYLRTPEDSNNIAKAAKNKDVVILGTSFIGMEVASYLADKAKSVTMIGRGSVPFATHFGEKIGGFIKELFEQKGVVFKSGVQIQEFKGEDELLSQVVLSDGELLPAAVCVIGKGVAPCTSFLAGSGVSLDSQGHVIVNQYMRTSKDNVYAAGDIVSFPLYLNDNSPTNIGHWQMAMAQGRCAGLNMLLRDEPIHSVPFFWTVLFGKSIRYCGYGAGYQDIILHGDESKFVAFYTKKERVVAVASLNFDPIVAVAAELMNSEIIIPASAVRDDPLALHSLVPK